MGVNSLPKTVARQRRDCDLNPRPSAPESSTLTTRLPSHPCRRTRAENSRDPGGLWAFDHQTIDTDDAIARCRRHAQPAGITAASYLDLRPPLSRTQRWGNGSMSGLRSRGREFDLRSGRGYTTQGKLYTPSVLPRRRQSSLL